ncbi:phosphatase PAP2 family protein [Pseudoxanthomonas composti]|uniref:Phosphatase PAP2 family protein n=2 Tax=Pseudoxanthomonas composti TaxID=2137479 RepID=A0A4Q1JZG6_9GAMM|nr:phosphatase PAP2 family protein [Pseudoxanthomonas composti]
MSRTWCGGAWCEMNALEQLLTWMGDARLLLPVIAAMALLWWRTRPRMALEWGALVAAMGATVAASKLAYIVWGIDWQTLRFYGFSGHSAMSATVYPVALYALCARARALRWPAVAAGALLALVVGFSRAAMNLHSASEIVGGLALGTMVSGAMIYRWRQQLAIHWAPMAGAWLLAVLLVLAVPSVAIEDLLQRLGGALHAA